MRYGFTLIYIHLKLHIIHITIEGGKEGEGRREKINEDTPHNLAKSPVTK